MLIVFNPNESRVFSRNRSLSKLPLVIADDVNPTDDVEIEYLEDKILVSKSENQPESISTDAEWLFIGKAVGLFGEKKVESAIELTLCDDAVAVHILKGAIAVHPDESKVEDVIVIQAGIEDCPPAYVSELKWVDSASFIGYCKYFGDLADKYPMDYMYQLLILGAGGRMGCIELKKQGILDISFGALAVVRQKEEQCLRDKQIKSAMSTLTSAEEEPKFDSYDEGEEPDEDEDMYNY